MPKHDPIKSGYTLPEQEEKDARAASRQRQKEAQSAREAREAVTAGQSAKYYETVEGFEDESLVTSESRKRRE